MGCGASSGSSVEDGSVIPKGALGRKATVQDEYNFGQQLGTGAFAVVRT